MVYLFFWLFKNVLAAKILYTARSICIIVINNYLPKVK